MFIALQLLNYKHSSIKSPKSRHLVCHAVGLSVAILRKSALSVDMMLKLNKILSSELARFLDASTHLYKRVCPSVRRSGTRFFQ